MGQTKTGFFERTATAEFFTGVPRYRHHRYLERPPDQGQPATDRKWTVHADPALTVFLCDRGFVLATAREACDLLCNRIESFFWESWTLRRFNAHRVWVVSIVHADAPDIRPSRGLLKGHHLVLVPQNSTLGGPTMQPGFGPARDLTFAATGTPQLSADPKLGGTTTRARSIKSDNFHLVTAANPVFHLLNDPSPNPHKESYFLFDDLWTLDSAPLAPLHAPSTWRLSWCAPEPDHSPRGVQAALAGLPGGSFLVPTHKDDKRVTADRLDRNEVIQGIAVVFEVLPTVPAARPTSSHAAEGIARRHAAREDASGEGSGFDVGRSKTCVVM